MSIFDSSKVGNFVSKWYGLLTSQNFYPCAAYKVAIFLLLGAPLITSGLNVEKNLGKALPKFFSTFNVSDS